MVTDMLKLIVVLTIAIFGVLAIAGAVLVAFFDDLRIDDL